MKYGEKFEVVIRHQSFYIRMHKDIIIDDVFPVVCGSCATEVQNGPQLRRRRHDYRRNSGSYQLV